MISKKLFTAVLLSLSISFLSKAQKISLKTTDLVPSQVTVKEGKYKNKNALILEIQGEVTNEKTMAVLKNIDFHNGTIEVTVSGQTNSTASETARGFVGIAFRVAEDISKMEVFYLRPTNGRANDQVRRNHSTQYISWPGYPWEKLRKETPEKYESYADLVPGEWTKVKIEVKDETAKLYVNGATQPTLVINDLKQGGNQRGSIGLWIGPGTLGHFTDLKITKLD
ncbi:family 16 glycoside hydrolase [Chryseobacterium kwangjuense]|uniref:Family 16 glycoside hydrolase n=1 Tax=Chryseobacterium kwangjuense TaxID=267125 RepID=A0ABW9K5Y5_9FLAO